jgi:hypothetical protein
MRWERSPKELKLGCREADPMGEERRGLTVGNTAAESQRAEGARLGKDQPRVPGRDGAPAHSALVFPSVQNQGGLIPVIEKVTD